MKKESGLKKWWIGLTIGLSFGLLGGYFYFDKKAEMKPGIGYVTANRDSLILQRADSVRLTGKDSLTSDSIAKAITH